MNKRQHKKHDLFLEHLFKMRLIHPKRGCNYMKLLFKRSYRVAYQVNVKKRYKMKGNEDYE